MTDLAAKIHQGIYGKSDKLNAPENDNADFKAGFAAGNDSPRDNWDSIWEAEYVRRGSHECDFDRWREWKRGWHAARMQKAMTNYTTR